jgi:NAD(P)-dependent dehydrogenase (short-subunit alcohol dehydrogenase family)
MENRLALITGATDGIGKATAIALAKQGFTVVVHGRNEQKTKQVRDEIKALTGNERTGMLVADMSLLQEVRKMANEFKKQYNRLDILINNAGGMMNKERETTTEGFEKTIALNTLAPFLLTELLLNLLKQSKDGRIINVASNAHHINAKPNFNDLQLEKGYDPLRAYGNSKLFLIWLTQQLNAQLQKQGFTNVTANSLHPGAVKTGFAVNSNLGPVLNTMVKLMRPFFKTVEQGADTIIYLATANIPEKGGLYYVNRKAIHTGVKYYSQENEKMIWDYSVKLTAN